MPAVVAYADEEPEVLLEETAEVPQPLFEFNGQEMTAEQLAVAQENALTTETKSSEAAKKLKEQEEVQVAFNAALDLASSALGELAGIDALKSELLPYFIELGEAWNGYQETSALRAPLEAERRECIGKRTDLLSELEHAKADRAEALYGLLLADRELSLSEGSGVAAVIVGTSNITDADALEYCLEKIAQSHAKIKANADANVERLEAEIAELDKQIETLDTKIIEAVQAKQDAHDALETVVGEGNRAAFAIEKLASEARQTSREAITSVESLNDKVEGVPEMKIVAGEWDLRFNSSRVQALDTAGQWYDAVDALVGLEGAISYGCGLDFELSEEDFVAKWGPAIDTFFTAQGAPLKGYGNVMAKQAYAYKIDPRLCAAVSIVESSGGHYCIKPHNAWGWGAADSDPYNLASGWASWEEAIESWHRGMATSGTGLATTPSLTAMGDIYCSTPIWGQRVATLMEQIDSCVVASQQNSTDLSI